MECDSNRCHLLSSNCLQMGHLAMANVEKHFHPENHRMNRTKQKKLIIIIYFIDKRIILSIGNSRKIVNISPIIVPWTNTCCFTMI